MSALPAETTELSPVRVARRPGAARPQQRARRRAVEATARRARRRWAIFSLTVLGLAFALTVGILDVLH
jgi:F0F1-type ATP synthase membrane subunit c/vacuolar-type H+-ATPase subunit K